LFSKTVIAEKNDLMGSEEATKRNLFGFQAKPNIIDKTNVYALGERASVLTKMDDAVIATHVASMNNQVRLNIKILRLDFFNRAILNIEILICFIQKFPFEAIFRSLNRMIMDNASTEYLFIQDFFHAKSDEQMDVFNTIFGDVIKLAKVMHFSIRSVALLLFI
jgi:hypothetical protein